MTEEQMNDFMINQVNKQIEWRALFIEQQKAIKKQKSIDYRDNQNKANAKYRASKKGVLEAVEKPASK